MPSVWPTHYALSEALIVVGAIYAVTRTWHLHRWFATGLAVIALGALAGAIRIVGGLTGNFVRLHELLSTYGALFGLGCMVGALWGWQAPRWKAALPFVLGSAAVALGLALPVMGQALVALLLLGGAIWSYRGAGRVRLLAAASFAVLVLAPLVSAPIRPENPVIAWHVFHTLVALWFVLVGAFVAQSLPSNGRSGGA